jgi:hypothetical protein
MEKALAVLISEGASEETAHREAAALVAEDTGLSASTVRRKHREVRDTLTDEEREDYRRSLRMDGLANQP